MRKFLRYLLLKPILWLVARFDAAPNRERIFEALTTLQDGIKNKPGKKGFIIPMDSLHGRFIIFSDQHKGAKNGADDFQLAEPNYLAALKYYNEKKFHLIILGDSEELWENTLLQVKKNNVPSFDAEKEFVRRNAFTKIFGNHDLDWEINPSATNELKELYGAPVAPLEGVILQADVGGSPLSIFCTHGHQGDEQSDGNLLSKFFISKIWAPLQAYLRINPNTPAYNATLKTEHNSLMYEWSSRQQNVLLITGHTHQPVFESLTHLERLQRQQENEASSAYANIKPTYFNTGCCCFDDGDITGIELIDGTIKLIKWEWNGDQSKRIELEATTLEKIITQLNHK